MPVKTKPVTKIIKKQKNITQIRINKNKEMNEIIGKVKFYFPILDDNEVVKLLISKGSLVLEKELNLSSNFMSKVLTAKKSNNMFVTGLTEEEEMELIKN